MRDAGSYLHGAVAPPTIRDLLAGRYGTTFNRIVKAGLVGADFEDFLWSAGDVAIVEAGVPINRGATCRHRRHARAVGHSRPWFAHPSPEYRGMAALLTADLGFTLHQYEADAMPDPRAATTWWRCFSQRLLRLWHARASGSSGRRGRVGSLRTTKRPSFGGRSRSG